MTKIFSLKKSFAFCCLFLAPIVSVAQARMTSPGSNSPQMPAECLKNPSLPGCVELQQQQQERSPSIQTFPEQIQVPNAREDRNNPQDRNALQPYFLRQKEEPTEFQQFVTTSVGKELPLFGRNLFEQVPSTFAPADKIPVMAEYVIGPGDELLIRAWGQIDMDARVIVDRTGSIYIPRVGSITVAGVQYRQLPEFLKTNIGRIFRNFDLTVSLGQLRSIQVFVVGQARRPGVYTVSSLSTLVNTLFASGGPSNRGSMRHIQLKRNGETISEFDLYDLLLNGDKSKDVVLRPNDVIYIPPVGPQVAVFGSVNMPAIYELADHATLKTQLGIAGGLTSVADGDKVILERIDNHTTRKVEEFKLNGDGMGRELRDGDLIRVFQITPRFDNAITLRGNVAQPGRYPWHEGMRIRDLIPNKEFLLTRTFWEQQNLTAQEKKFGTTQQEEEQSVRKGRQRQDDTRQSQAPDQMKKEQMPRGTRDNRMDNNADNYNNDDTEEDRTKTEDLKNDVKRNAPEINWEYAVIQRLDHVSLTTSLIAFNLGEAILHGSDAENKVLEPGDIVTIFSQADISVGFDKQSKFVRLEGELKAPGIYKVEPGETLRDVVMRAGGLTSKAYLYGAEFTRETVRKEQKRTLDEMVRNLEQELQRKTAIAESRPEQQANIMAQTQADQAFMQKLRAVKPTGRIVLELQPTQTDVAEIPDLALEDGDRFVVPFKSSTVTVMGAVYNQSSFIFKDGMPINKYLALAGNGNRNADSKHMFLLRADGSVISREQVSGIWGGGFGSIRSRPGDMLVVPTQVEKGAVLRGLKDWSQVISQFGLGIAAVAVLTN